MSMDEVRTYWQVASISHFCDLFKREFKLPTFEFEDLEHSFITSIPDYRELAEQDSDSIDADEFHLLLKLAIALLKPHYSVKISYANWEVYLRRIIEKNWVELENLNSPFKIPILSQDGVELTKTLTFNELPLRDKIEIFHSLCDYRLWCDDVSDSLKEFAPEYLRLESIGKDSKGFNYWYFCGTRLYKEDKAAVDEIARKDETLTKLKLRLLGFEKQRIIREKAEKLKAEQLKARKLAAEAREQRLPTKRQRDQADRSAKRITPPPPLRMGLRERRSSAATNAQRTPATDTPKPKTPATKDKRTTQPEAEQSSAPKKSPEEECREQLELNIVTIEDRAKAWSVACESLEEWESFSDKISKSKSQLDRHLHNVITESLLPGVRNIYMKRVQEMRRKEKEMLLSLASRRVSSRIISKKSQEEEEERIARVQEEQMRKKTEAEERLKEEIAREIRLRKEKLLMDVAKTIENDSQPEHDDNHRYNLRPYFANIQIDDIISPEKLSEFYEGLENVMAAVMTRKTAWPFLEPVPQNVPGYYDTIKDPIDLSKISERVKMRRYKSLLEIEKDFKLLVNNCETFNGPVATYTKMAHSIWRSFRKNINKFLQWNLSMDDKDVFLFPPAEQAPLDQAPAEPAPVELAHSEPTPAEPAPIKQNPPKLRLHEPMSLEINTVRSAFLEEASAESAPVETAPLRQNSIELRPDEPVSQTLKSAFLKQASAESAPVELAFTESTPVKPSLLKQNSIELIPDEPVSLGSLNVESAPVEKAPVESEAVESAPLKQDSVELRPDGPVSLEPSPLDPVIIKATSPERAPVGPVSFEPTLLETTISQEENGDIGEP